MIVGEAGEEGFKQHRNYTAGIVDLTIEKGS